MFPTRKVSARVHGHCDVWSLLGSHDNVLSLRLGCCAGWGLQGAFGRPGHTPLRSVPGPSACMQELQATQQQDACGGRQGDCLLLPIASKRVAGRLTTTGCMAP